MDNSRLEKIYEVLYKPAGHTNQERLTVLADKMEEDGAVTNFYLDGNKVGMVWGKFCLGNAGTHLSPTMRVESPLLSP